MDVNSRNSTPLPDPGSVVPTGVEELLVRASITRLRQIM